MQGPTTGEGALSVASDGRRSPSSVTIASGKVTDVQAVELPSGGRSGQISLYASPILASEALTAQSASIDVVSGATYTSEAYAQSLQAALDQAGITTSTVSG